MNMFFNQRLGFTVAFSLMSVVAGSAAEPAPRARGTPIIFAAPTTSDTVSSNLNELRTPVSPFRNLEAELKKPFEALEPEQRANRIRAPRQPNQQQPELNRKQMKERLHDRAEAMFLSLEQDDSQLGDELLTSSDDSLNNKSREWDRYNDQADQSRATRTNQSAPSDPFGEKKDQEDRPLGFSSDRNPGSGLENRGIASRNLRPLSDGIAPRDSLFSDRPNSQALIDPWGNSADDSFERAKLKRETRLDEFKRLLDGPGAAPREKGIYGSAYHLNPQQPASRPTATSPSWSEPKPVVKTAPAPTFAETAGLVGTPGTPSGLPDFDRASSLSTPPSPVPQAKPLVPSTFKIPKRRF